MTRTKFLGGAFTGGEILNVYPKKYEQIHISVVTMGQVADEATSADSVPVKLTVDGKTFVVGTLSTNFRQILLDLEMDKAFQLSHDWFGGKVYYCGYVRKIRSRVSGSAHAGDTAGAALT